GGARAIGAVLRVHAVAFDGDLGALERDVLTLGDDAHGHRCTTAERSVKIVVRSGAFVGTACVDGLVDDQAMAAGLDFRAEFRPGTGDNGLRHVSTLLW